MFNFEMLDKKQTYVGLQYGTSFVAKRIQKYSREYAPKSDKIPTHVMGLKYRYGAWWIFESHAKGYKKLGIPQGVRRIKQTVWEQVEATEEFAIYPLKLKVKSLEEYVGQQYGIGDIKSLMKASIFHSNGEQKDHDGLICSEYIALCNDKICKYYDLPAHCITPAHFQNYFDEKGIEAIGGGHVD